MFTVSDMLDRFVPEHFPKLARRTQIDGLRHVEILKEQFGHIEASELKPKQIGQWMNGGPARGKIQRGKIVSVLATAYRYAVGEWFVVDSNPTRDLRMPKGKRRTRYVTDAEFQAVRAICKPRLQAAMDLALITGQRQGDILKMKWSDIDVNRRLIHMKQGKTGKKFAIHVTEALEEVLVRCKRMEPMHPRQYVLRNKFGNKYSSEGFRALWQRFIKKALQLGAIKEKFTFHDIRAKCASDHADINKAGDLLGHQSVVMTKAVYDRSERVVEPLK
ncbi:MAG: tyrosine-type recombinase/integrase [Verrucomicrobiota bacterium]